MIRALIELGKTGAQNVMYVVLATFVNITNSFDHWGVNNNNSLGESLIIFNFRFKNTKAASHSSSLAKRQVRMGLVCQE
jgi:hypothetical protein